MGFKAPNYTQVPNELLDFHMRDMSEAELKITLAIVRHTIGYHKESVELTYVKLQELTGLCSGSVENGVHALAKRGLVQRGKRGKVSLWIVDEPPKNTPQNLGVQTDTTKNTPKILGYDTPQNLGVQVPLSSILKKEEKEIIHKRVSVQKNPEYPPGFKEFWATFPDIRKGSPREAYRVWVRDGLEDISETIIASVTLHIALHPDWKRKGKDGVPCVPMPTTWLNQARWETTLPGQEEYIRKMAEDDEELDKPCPSCGFRMGKDPQYDELHYKNEDGQITFVRDCHTRIISQEEADKYMQTFYREREEQANGAR